MVSIGMRDIQLFKRQQRQWVPRPTGGRHLTPEPLRVAEWLKSDFAQRLINKNVSQRDT